MHRASHSPCYYLQIWVIGQSMCVLRVCVTADFELELKSIWAAGWRRRCRRRRRRAAHMLSQGRLPHHPLGAAGNWFSSLIFFLQCHVWKLLCLPSCRDCQLVLHKELLSTFDWRWCFYIHLGCRSSDLGCAEGTDRFWATRISNRYHEQNVSKKDALFTVVRNFSRPTPISMQPELLS